MSDATLSADLLCKREDTKPTGEPSSALLADMNLLSPSVAGMQCLAIEDAEDGSTCDEIFDGKNVDHPCCSTFGALVADIAATSPNSQNRMVNATEFLQAYPKQVFILSEAGKPVYTRYGSEEELSSFMGVIQALVSFISSRNGDDDNPDELVSMEAGLYRFVFARRPPLILCIVSRLGDSYPQLSRQLTCLYRYIVSVLTASQLRRIFDERKNFDLRRLLTGTERTLDRLICWAEKDFSLMLDAILCLAMPSSLRETFMHTLSSQCAYSKSIVFAIILVNDQLVAMSCMKNHALSPSDLHMLINLVASNPSFKDAESWSPICLPTFDENTFLSAHISYLSDVCPACLLLLTLDKGAFFEMSNIRTRIIEKLTRNKALTMLHELLIERSALNVVQLGIADLIHFIYKQRSRSQYTCVPMAAPYAEDNFQAYLFGRYAAAHGYMHQRAQTRNIHYCSGSLESILGWVTPNFEVYTVFSPLTTKNEAISRVELLMRWIKKEEANLLSLTVGVH
uniref:Vacuolar fusion protein MON1 homolog n=1 Tax=Trichuris muris TaxID=70415 RepID=A0A5S6R2E7_TRIMR